MKWSHFLLPALTAASTIQLDQRAENITEVTGCHMHGTSQFCIAGGQEYQVITQVDIATAPTTYTGCHAHDAEIHCTGNGQDVTLALFSDASTSAEDHDHDHDHETSAGGSSESSGGRNLPPGVSCHDHAGVPHCVDANGNTVNLGCARPENNYNVPLRIGLLFVILVTSTLGVFLPIITARFTNFNHDHVVLIFIRQFGTGVIISTAVVHLFTHAQLYFSNECLTGLKYEATAGAILMAGLFITFLISYLSRRCFGGGPHSHSVPRAVPATADKVQPTSDEESLSSADGHYNAKLATVSVSVLEAGIIFHSILIGITLVVADNSGFITLFVVILFHQIFEGLALGSRIAMLGGAASMLKKSILALAFGITTPIGMAIGIGVLSKFNGNDPSTIIAIGTLNAFSAGILLWVGVVEMWYEEWFGHGVLARSGALKTGIGMFALLAGIILMSVLGKWA